MTLALPPAPPTSSLARVLEHVGVAASLGGGGHTVELLPDGRTALVFRVHEEGRRADLSVLGPRTHALFKKTGKLPRVVFLQLKPGWAASLLGVAASALTDRVVPLQDLWGRSGDELCFELLGARSVPEMIDRISRVVASRAQDTFEPASARLARRAVHMLEEGEVRVESVAERLGVTARHLRRVFSENVGVGPKEFARSVRLQRAVRMAASSRSATDWVRIAADAGYYDQAHLIAEFRELVGLTPGAFARRAAAR